MISNYITRIKANISIYSTKKAENILDGTYRSIFTGRSMNFEDLKEYVPGDNIRDIDWKASSRNRNLLVKRYVAEKKHNIMLVFDTGQKMLGDTILGEAKYDVAAMAGGTIGYLTNKNGDNIGSVYNKDGLIQYYQLKNGLYNLERILSSYASDAKSDMNNDINKSLEFILKNIRRHMIIFIISDSKGISTISDVILKKLKYQHDILFYDITDAMVTGGTSYSMKSKSYVPSFINSNKKLAAFENSLRMQLDMANAEKIKKCGIVSVKISGQSELTEKTIELLERQRYANSTK